MLCVGQLGRFCLQCFIDVAFFLATFTKIFYISAFKQFLDKLLIQSYIALVLYCY